MRWVSESCPTPIKKDVIIKCRISKVDDLGNRMVCFILRLLIDRVL